MGVSDSVNVLKGFFEMRAKDVYADAHSVETIKDALGVAKEHKKEAETRAEVVNDRGYMCFNFEPLYDPDVVTRCEVRREEGARRVQGEGVGRE